MKKKKAKNKPISREQWIEGIIENSQRQISKHNDSIDELFKNQVVRLKKELAGLRKK